MWLLVVIPFCCSADTGGTVLFPYEETFRTEQACRAALKERVDELARLDFQKGQKFKPGLNYDIKCVEIPPGPTS